MEYTHTKVLSPLHRRRKKSALCRYLYSTISLLSQYYYLPYPQGKSSERILAPKTSWWCGGYLNALPSKAPKLCLPLPFILSRSLFVPAQQSHRGERRRRQPRGGKQVPGCQSRTRPEQERTGLNRREQIPAGLPARHRRRRPRAPLYIRHTSPALALAQPSLLGGGRGGRAAALPLSTPQLVTGSIWLGPPWHLYSCGEGNGGGERWGRGGQAPAHNEGGKEEPPRSLPSVSSSAWPALAVSPLRSNEGSRAGDYIGAKHTLF